MTAVNFPNRPAAEQRNIDRQRNCRLASETVTGTENAADIAPPNEEPPVSVDGRRMPGSGSQRHNTRQQPAAVRRHNPARLRFIPETARSEPAVAAAASPCRHRSVAVQNRNMPAAAGNRLRIIDSFRPNRFVADRFRSGKPYPQLRPVIRVRPASPRPISVRTVPAPADYPHR